MNELVIAYALGMATGVGVAWWLMSMRVAYSPGAVKLAHDAVSQAVFIRSVTDVVDEQTCEEIQERANERLAELDAPGNPEWHYDNP